MGAFWYSRQNLILAVNRADAIDDYQFEPQTGALVSIADQSDAVVVLRCQLGDSHAWEVLVRRWHPRLWRFILRMLPDHPTAEDVLQVVWLRVVRSLGQLRDPHRLPAWLFGIARRAVADHLRAAYRRPPTEQFGEISVSDDAVELIAVVEAIQAGLQRLHPTDREAVILHYLEELPVADVAEICGVPPGTIKSRLHRARRVIHDTLT
jgi:RNA polymerase sigma factor (sigma-70 family)